MKKILLLDSIHPSFVELLTKAGHQIADGTTWSRKETLVQLSDFSGVCLRSRISVDKEFLDAGKGLQFIARAGSGLDGIDLEEAAKRNVACINSPEGNADAVGEHTLGMMLAMMNNMLWADRDIRTRKWNREVYRGIEVKGKTLGLIGYGVMGKTFAMKCAGLGMNILAFDKYKKGFGSHLVKEVSMEEIFSETEIVSFHVPLNEETRFMVDEAFLSNFKKNFYLLNTARGKILRIADLVNALKSGKVLGACLDVLEFEEPSFEKLNENELAQMGSGIHPLDYLFQAKNVLLTPHIAGWTHESKVKLATILAEKVIAFCKQNKIG